MCINRSCVFDSLLSKRSKKAACFSRSAIFGGVLLYRYLPIRDRMDVLIRQNGLELYESESESESESENENENEPENDEKSIFDLTSVVSTRLSGTVSASAINNDDDHQCQVEQKKHVSHWKSENK
jgi:predicted nucleic acid-binding protein